MLMQNARSGDQFGVNYNWDFILLQIRECSEDHEEARIKLRYNDVDDLIDMLLYYQEKLRKWKDEVGHQRDGETELEFQVRVHQTLKENNYFIDRQEL